MTEIKNPILTVQRTLSATPELAFAAWSQAEQVRKWWGGWPEDAAPEMQIEPVVGGSYRFAMAMGENVQWVSGEITAIDAPARLEFTFTWEGGDPIATPVVLEFAEAPDGKCELRLVHDQTLGGNACVEGWTWSLDCLADYLEDQG